MCCSPATDRSAIPEEAPGERGIRAEVEVGVAGEEAADPDAVGAWAAVGAENSRKVGERGEGFEGRVMELMAADECPLRPEPAVALGGDRHVAERREPRLHRDPGRDQAPHRV